MSNLFKEVMLWSPGLVFDKFPTLDSGLKDVELQSSAQRPLAREPLSCHRSILEVPCSQGSPEYHGEAQTDPISPLRTQALV